MEVLEAISCVFSTQTRACQGRPIEGPEHWSLAASRQAAEHPCSRPALGSQKEEGTGIKLGEGGERVRGNGSSHL